MRTNKARRPRISQACCGVSPRRVNASHTSPGFPTFATQGVPESRASIVIRRRVLFVFTARNVGTLVALRRVAPRQSGATPPRKANEISPKEHFAS